MRRPGIEPGPQPVCLHWQGRIVPLNHRRNVRMNLKVLLKGFDLVGSFLTHNNIKLFCNTIVMVVERLESFVRSHGGIAVAAVSISALLGAVTFVLSAGQQPVWKLTLPPPATPTPRSTSTAYPTVSPSYVYPTPGPTATATPIGIDEFDFKSYDGGSTYQSIKEQSDVRGISLRNANGDNIDGFADTIALHPDQRTYYRDEWLDRTRRTILLEGEFNVEHLIDEFHRITTASDAYDRRNGDVVALDRLGPDQYAVNIGSFKFEHGWERTDVIDNLKSLQDRVENIIRDSSIDGRVAAQFRSEIETLRLSYIAYSLAAL